MNGKSYWEVQCIQSYSPSLHSENLAEALCEGWEIITNGLLTTYLGEESNLQLMWYATLKRLVKPSRLATSEFERHLMELELEGDALTQRVQRDASELLASGEPLERAEIATRISENVQVSSHVLMLLAEAMFPVMPENTVYRTDALAIVQ